MMSVPKDEERKSHVIPSRRREGRRTVSGRAVAQVVGGNNPNVEGRTFRTQIVDVSPGGMRLLSGEFVEDCQIDIWVSVEGQLDKLYLTTEVRWASWEEDGEYELGLEVISKRGTDAEKWVDLWN